MQRVKSKFRVAEQQRGRAAKQTDREEMQSKNVKQIHKTEWKSRAGKQSTSVEKHKKQNGRVN